MKSTFQIFLACVMWSPLTALAEPSGTVLEQSSVNAGGGAAKASGIDLQGTLGQLVVGFSEGGETQLQAGFWIGKLEVVVIYDNAFEEWMDNLPTSEKPPEGQRGQDDIPAGDGVSNLLKYAFGLMPLTASADAMPNFTVDSSDFIGLSFTRSADADVNLTLLGSENLENWTEVPYGETIIEAGLPNNRVDVDLLTSLKKDDTDSYFLRLVIEVN